MISNRLCADTLRARSVLHLELGGSRSEFYRQRAAQVRRDAARIESAKVKEEFEKIAREYEALAKALDLGLFGEGDQPLR